MIFLKRGIAAHMIKSHAEGGAQWRGVPRPHVRAWSLAGLAHVIGTDGGVYEPASQPELAAI